MDNKRSNCIPSKKEQHYKIHRLFLTTLLLCLLLIAGCARVKKAPFYNKWDQKCLNVNYTLSETKKVYKGECAIVYGSYETTLGEVINFTANKNIEFSGGSSKDRDVNPGNVIYKINKKIFKNSRFSAPYKKISSDVNEVYYMEIEDIFVTTEKFHAKNNYLIIGADGSIKSDLLYCDCDINFIYSINETSCHVVKTDLAKYFDENLFSKQAETVFLYENYSTPFIAFELLFYGKHDNNIKLLYKEYIFAAEDRQFKSTAAQELTYNLDESDIVRYKNYKIQILEATDKAMTYKVLEDKIDRSLFDYVKISQKLIIPLISNYFIVTKYTAF